MKKSDIETRYHRREPVPCLNVKVYRMGAYARDVAEHFKCSEAQAEKALEFAFNSAQSQFWEDITETAAHYLARQFGKRFEVYSDGRSGGWLIVTGLPDIESWDALKVSAWGNFARAIAREIAYQCSREQLLDAIGANEWHKDGSEAYNFVDTATGPACIADLKAAAIAAGFAPVVRS